MFNHKHFSKILLTALLSFFVVTGFANSANQHLLHLLSNVKSMTASFTQKAVGRSSRMRQSTSGTMALLKPGRFRWDIVRPNKQMIIADGKQLWVYDVDLQQATVQGLQKSIGHSPAMILSGSNSSLLKGYLVTQTSASSNNVWFSLRAKKRNETFSAVELHFVGGIISQMRITDNLGQKSIVSFSHVRINPNLRKGIFNFKPPRGVDVIKN